MTRLSEVGGGDVRTRTSIATLAVLAIAATAQLGYDRPDADTPGRSGGGNPRRNQCRRCTGTYQQQPTLKYKCNQCGDLVRTLPKSP